MMAMLGRVIRVSSFYPDLGLTHYGSPFGNLAPQHGGEFGRRPRVRLGADLQQALADRRLLQQAD
jgi:hypothetical protein